MTKEVENYEKCRSVKVQTCRIKNGSAFIKKRPKHNWTREEDEILRKLIEKKGPSNWSLISEQMPGRQGKQCRERWHNHLNPAIKKNDWTDQEEWLLFLLHRLYGNKWAVLTKLIKGRTDNTIKNHWNSIMKKKILSLDEKLKNAIVGIDGVTDLGFEETLIKRIKVGDLDRETGRRGRKRNTDFRIARNNLDYILNENINKTNIDDFDEVKFKTNKDIFSDEKIKSEEKHWIFPFLKSQAEFTPLIKKTGSFISLGDTRTQNHLSNELRLKSGEQISSFCSMANLDCLPSTPQIEKFFISQPSETSMDRRFHNGDNYYTPIKCFLDCSNNKLFKKPSPIYRKNISCSINSLKMFWDIN